MNCNIIGAGRLGKNIALALYTKKLISFFSICNQSLESSLNVCQTLKAGQVVEALHLLPEANITWICCNDDAIESVVSILSNHSLLKPGNFIIHCSGVLSSDILVPFQKKGCYVASFHPLKAFKTGYLDLHAFEGVDCVLEGDLPALSWLRDSFNELGANLIEISPEAKAIYHAAACMTSNYLITLASCSEELFLKAGIAPQQSRRMMINLMQGNLNNLKNTKSIAESLTGPLARGDTKTISLHLNSIDDSQIKSLYKIAALNTLPMTSLSEDIKQKIIHILNSESF